MKKIIIETKKLKEMLESVKGACSKEDFRPIFKGILLEVEGKRLTMTACDGCVLFTNSCELIKGDSFTTNIPIFEIPKGAAEETEIELEEEYINFNFRNVRYSYKILIGEFIDYKSYLRRISIFSIRFNSKLLIKALRNSKGIVEMYFAGDKDAVIIKEIQNEDNQKYVLPYSKNK